MNSNDCLEKQPLCDEMLTKMNAWWRAANYLAAGQLYLLDNPLLREPLKREHVKHKIVGHWGTCLLYTSLFYVLFVIAVAVRTACCEGIFLSLIHISFKGSYVKRYALENEIPFEEI